MCGIVGYVGPRQAAPILLDGLSKLEYRGYDSAGIAVRDADKFKDGLPAVFHRRNRTEWLVTMTLTDWIRLYKRFGK